MSQIRPLYTLAVSTHIQVHIHVKVSYALKNIWFVRCQHGLTTNFNTEGRSDGLPGTSKGKHVCKSLSCEVPEFINKCFFFGFN